MPPLVKQPRDDRSLEEDHSTNRQKLRPILPQYSRYAKKSLGAGHQAIFTDPPALHFSKKKKWALGQQQKPFSPLFPLHARPPPHQCSSNARKSRTAVEAQPR